MTGECSGTPEAVADGAVADDGAAGSEGPWGEGFVGAVMTLRSCHGGTTARAHRHPVATTRHRTHAP
ncbi:hypothetical protein GCM10010424_70210 [Streptomyces lienomycini]